jgi:hypothetical protein
MGRSGQIMVCGVTIDVGQEAAVDGCCDVAVSPASFRYDWCAGVDTFIGYLLTIHVTLLNPTIPSASTDVSWLHVSDYTPQFPTGTGIFQVTVDFPVACTERVGHVFICDETVTITQPFSIVLTPNTASVNGNTHADITTLVSGDWNNTPGFSLSVVSLSGRSIMSGAFITHLPSCADPHLVVDTNGANTYYEPGTLGVYGDLCPVGETLILTVTACDGTNFVITQAPKGIAQKFIGTGHTAITAPTPTDLTNTSTITLPLFDPNYPAPASAVWELPFDPGSLSAPVDHWTIVTVGGNSVTFTGTDPGPYYLTGAQLAEMITKMHQGTCITHTNWSATVTIIGLQGRGPGFVIPSGVGAATIDTTP